MSKKRTKKQKARALEHLKNRYNSPANLPGPSLVKREFIVKAKNQLSEAKKQKKPNLLAENLDIKVIKRDLVKSLLFASLIFVLTTMIYLAWK